MHPSRWRRARIALAVGALGLLAGCAQASPVYFGPPPSASSPWKIVQRIGPRGGDAMMQDIAAVGPQSAWAIAQGCAGRRGCASQLLVVEHWDGSTWRKMPAVPRQARGALNGFVAASSDSDVWVLAQLEQGTLVLHWNGRHWSTAGAPACGQVSPIVFAPDNVWAFPAGNQACAAHFDGRSWHTVSMPGAPNAVSALSSHDIWATGPSAATGSTASTSSPAHRTYLAMHWDGSSWSGKAIPTPPMKSTQSLTGGHIVVSAPSQVWVSYGIQTKAANTSYPLLMHWNGRAWNRVLIQIAPYGVWSMARDGTGGMWLTAAGTGPAGVNWYFYHFSHGKLGTVAAPASGNAVQLFGAGKIAWIPGTRSMWGIETLSSGSGGSQGAILHLSH